MNTPHVEVEDSEESVELKWKVMTCLEQLQKFDQYLKEGRVCLEVGRVAVKNTYWRRIEVGVVLWMKRM